LSSFNLFKRTFIIAYYEAVKKLLGAKNRLESREK